MVKNQVQQKHQFRRNFKGKTELSGLADALASWHRFDNKVFNCCLHKTGPSYAQQPRQSYQKLGILKNYVSEKKAAKYASVVAKF